VTLLEQSNNLKAPMTPLNLTAIIITYNEALHIARCIKSVRQIARDVVVVDSYSSDNTIEIAQALGARVFRNRWVNHAVQVQWAIDNTAIESDWVMRIDADECIEPSLVKALSTSIAKLSESTTGLRVRRKYFFLGHWIRHGAMHPLYVLRVWRNGVARIEQRWMDEHVVINRGETVNLDGDIVDDNLNSITWWIDKHNHYASREMIEMLNKRHGFLPTDVQLKQQAGNSQAKWKRVIKDSLYVHMPLFIRPTLYFFYRYFLRFGFLDGAKGFSFHFMQAFWYRALVDVKLLEAEEWIKSCGTKEEIKAVLADKTGLSL
jgi:glycosyltransferase involved in cell wall biosynthesis